MLCWAEQSLREEAREEDATTLPGDDTIYPLSFLIPSNLSPSLPHIMWLFWTGKSWSEARCWAVRQLNRLLSFSVHSSCLCARFSVMSLAHSARSPGQCWESLLSARVTWCFDKATLTCVLSSSGSSLDLWFSDTRGEEAVTPAGQGRLCSTITKHHTASHQTL